MRAHPGVAVSFIAVETYEEFDIRLEDDGDFIALDDNRNRVARSQKLQSLKARIRQIIKDKHEPIPIVAYLIETGDYDDPQWAWEKIVGCILPEFDRGYLVIQDGTNDRKFSRGGYDTDWDEVYLVRPDEIKLQLKIEKTFGQLNVACDVANRMRGQVKQLLEDVVKTEERPGYTLERQNAELSRIKTELER